jgi:hypothetical protein
MKCKKIKINSDTSLEVGEIMPLITDIRHPVTKIRYLLSENKLLFCIQLLGAYMKGMRGL